VFTALFIDRDLAPRLNITKFRRKAYARLWLANGASCAKQLPGNTSSLLTQSSGVMLEIGAGNGELLALYSPQRVEKIYGVEPSEDLSHALRDKAESCGFGEKYVVLECGAEPTELVPNLAKVGCRVESLKEGFFDTIICVRVLCMVPEIEETVRVLYECLKPGGRIVLCEHGVNEWRRGDGSFTARVFQWLYMSLGWRILMGECHLDRDMRKIFVQVAENSGGWTDIQLQTIDADGVLPYTVGYLVK
jgi:SAM-dependent methyltransferase